MPNKPTVKRKPWQEERVVHKRKKDNSKIYNGRKWRKFRKEKLKEEPLCRKCLNKGVIKEAKVVDHIRRIEDGGEIYSNKNTQSLCSRCHNQKSGKEAHGYKESN